MHTQNFFWVRRYSFIWSLSAYLCMLKKDKLDDIHIGWQWVCETKEKQKVHSRFHRYDTTCFPFCPVWCRSFCSSPCLFFILCSYISCRFFSAFYYILAQAEWILAWCPHKRYTKLPLWKMAASRCEYNDSHLCVLNFYKHVVSILVNSTCQSVQKMWYILCYRSSIKGIVLAYLQPKGKRKCSDYVGICSALL